MNELKYFLTFRNNEKQARRNVPGTPFLRFLLAVEQAPAGNSSRDIALQNIVYNLLEKQEKNNLQIVNKCFRKKIRAEK